MNFYQINIEQGQTIWDVAIQEYGDVMKAWIVLEDNSGVLTDLNTDLLPSMKLNIRTEIEVEDRELMKYFRTKKIHVNCN